MSKKSLLGFLNRIADEELGKRKRTKKSVSTKRDCSDKAKDFFSRKYDVIETKKQRNGLWTVIYRKR